MRLAAPAPRGCGEPQASGEHCNALQPHLYPHPDLSRHTLLLQITAPRAAFRQEKEKQNPRKEITKAPLPAAAKGHVVPEGRRASSTGRSSSASRSRESQAPTKTRSMPPLDMARRFDHTEIKEAARPIRERPPPSVPSDGIQEAAGGEGDEEVPAVCREAHLCTT